MHTYHLSSFNHLLFCNVRVAKRDVVHYRTREKKNILQYNTNVGSQDIEFIFLNVYTIECYCSFLNMIKPVQNTNDRSLPASCMTNQSNRFTRLNIKADIFQNPILIAVGEPNIIESNTAFNVFWRMFAFFLNEIIIIHYFKNSFRRNHSHLNSIEFISDHA